MTRREKASPVLVQRHHPQQPAEGDRAVPAESFARSNRGVGIALLSATAVLFASVWFSDWAHRELRDGFLLGGVPLFAIGVMAAAALVLIFDGRARTVEPEVAAFTLAAGLFVVVTLAVVGLVFLSFDIVGFVPAITLLIFGASTLLGFRPLWSAATVGIGVAFGLRAITYALGVDIQDGVIGSLIMGLL